jgi:hypothetical protein
MLSQLLEVARGLQLSSMHEGMKPFGHCRITVMTRMKKANERRWNILAFRHRKKLQS